MLGVVAVFVAFPIAKHPEARMNDEDLWKCNGSTLAGTASPRDRHTELEENVKTVTIVVITGVGARGVRNRISAELCMSVGNICCYYSNGLPRVLDGFA